MNKIQKSSRRIRILFQLCFFAVPILSLAYWLFFNSFVEGSQSDLYGIFFKFSYSQDALPASSLNPLSLGNRLLCFAIDMLPKGAIMYCFFHLIKLFKLYELGQIFSRDNINHIRKVSYGMFVLVVANFIAYALHSLAISFTNPVGQRTLSLRFDGGDFSILVIAFIILLISNIMDEGRKLKDEADQTI